MRRWLPAWLVSLALVAAVSGVIEPLQPHIPVLSLSVLYLLAVLPVAAVWGVAFGVVVSVLSAAVFAFVFLPPRYSVGVEDTQELFALAVFLLTAVVVGQLAAQSRRQARASARFAEEQAALRQVATLVARSVPPAEVFEAVTREVGHLCGADLARMERYQADGTVVGVAAWSRDIDQLAVGTRLALDGVSIAAQVRQTNGPVRVGSFAGSSGPIAEEARKLGIRSSVGCPIVVAGRLWGVIAASSKDEVAFPANAESQIADFTELVAAAIANADSRDELRRLAEEQAALRRVATLVARGVSSYEVFGTVAGEMGRILEADGTVVARHEDDDTLTVVGFWSAPAGPGRPLRARWPVQEKSVSAEVLRTGRPARMVRAEYEGGKGEVSAWVLDHGITSTVGTPIAVESRLWGVAVAFSCGAQPLPNGAEERMASFAELAATAIANAEARAELAASRARIVAASDATRRGIERDLHDGAQQRLVSLGLKLRAMGAAVPPGLPKVQEGIGQVADELDSVLDELREMSRGIHPAILSEGGLGLALRTLARRSVVPVELDARVDTRFPEPVEVAAYYVVAEALTNTTKHARASHAHVAVEERGETVQLVVRDDGVGGAEPARGSGLVGLRDRVEALGGSIDVRSPVGKGTLVVVELPVQAD